MTLLKSQGAELKNGEVELAVIEIGVHSHVSRACSPSRTSTSCSPASLAVALPSPSRPPRGGRGEICSRPRRGEEKFHLPTHLAKITETCHSFLFPGPFPGVIETDWCRLCSPGLGPPSRARLLRILRRRRQAPGAPFRIPAASRREEVEPPGALIR